MPGKMIDMKLKWIAGLFALILSLSGGVGAQVKPKPTPVPAAVSAVKATAAYSEVLLRKAERTAELEGLLSEYTEEYPTVRLIRTELGFLQKEIDRLLAVPATDTAKLSTALGKLMVLKVQAETELWKLQLDYADEHPDVKSVKRKISVFESAIREILG